MQVMLVNIILQMRKVRMVGNVNTHDCSNGKCSVKNSESCRWHSKVCAHFLKQLPLPKAWWSSGQRSYQGIGPTFSCQVSHHDSRTFLVRCAACSFFVFFLFFPAIYNVGFWYLLIILSTDAEHVFLPIKWICFWFLMKAFENYVFSILEIILKSSTHRTEIHKLFLLLTEKGRFLYQLFCTRF